MIALLILAYLALALAPLALSAAQDLPPRAVTDELASGLGMVALAILLVEFILSGRFRSISRPIGMDVTMRFHQLLARSALVLVLLHPILYSTWQRAEANDPTRQGFVSFELHGLVPGIISFLLLGAIVAMAIGRSELGYRYEIWRFLHGISAVAMAFFGVLHATRLGRYSQESALEWFWWAMLGLAVLSLLFVYIAKPIRKMTRPWKVTSVEKAADRMWHVTLEPDGHDGLTYEAGQFAWANFGHNAFSLHENPFSITSSPTAGPAVSFLIKELGDSTNRIGRLRPGTRAYLDAPHGNMTTVGRNEPGIALIAGGVGIAPMIGILREMRATADTRPSILVYGNRHERQIACPAELEHFARMPGTDVVHILSEPGPGWTGLTGHPDRKTLQALFDTPDRKRWLYILCGPPIMLDTVEDALIGIGIPSSQILSERFVYE
jgi:predicted ferric reductase